MRIGREEYVAAGSCAKAALVSIAIATAKLPRAGVRERRSQAVRGHRHG